MNQQIIICDAVWCLNAPVRASAGKPGNDSRASEPTLTALSDTASGEHVLPDKKCDNQALKRSIPA
jgi:hypothetical protein